MRREYIREILKKARALLKPKRYPFVARIITAYGANLRGDPAEFSMRDCQRGQDLIDGRRWDELREMEREIESREDNREKIKE